MFVRRGSTALLLPACQRNVRQCDSHPRTTRRSLSKHSVAAGPLGAFCLTGSPGPVNCPAGTMGRQPMLTSDTECESCPPGTSKWGRTRPLPRLLCHPHGYPMLCNESMSRRAGCTSGSSSAVPCSPGSHAPNASSTTCTRCKAGTHQDEEGQTTCKICPQGQLWEALFPPLFPLTSSIQSSNLSLILLIRNRPLLPARDRKPKILSGWYLE